MIAEAVLSIVIYSAYAVVFIGVLASLLAFLNKIKHSRYFLDESYRPKVSFIVPAYNEGQFIEKTIKKYLETTYPENLKEMIVVNDGSTDRTREIAERYACRIVDAETGKAIVVKGRKGNVTLVNRKEGGKGKSYALNDGIRFAKGDVYLITDGDIEISPDIFEKGVKHFADSEVGVVIGFASVKKSRKRRVITDFIDYEYESTQNLHRRGYNVLGAHYIVPGGMSFFRKGVIEGLGCYSARTLAEDTDLSFDILMKTKWKIRYDVSVRVWSNEPRKLRDLWNQRVRWARGNMQVTWLHRHKVGRPRYGMAATLLYPFWFANIILPIAFIVSTSGLLFSMLSGINIPHPGFLKAMLTFSFFGVWLIASILQRFRSSFAGLVSPGFFMLLGFYSFLFFDKGVIGLFEYAGIPAMGNLMASMLSVWLFISIPGTYLSLKVSDRNERLGQLLQFGVFGYWMFLITAAFHGYVMEIMGKERKWIKTRKD